MNENDSKLEENKSNSETQSRDSYLGCTLSTIFMPKIGPIHMKRTLSHSSKSSVSKKCRILCQSSDVIDMRTVSLFVFYQSFSYS